MAPIVAAAIPKLDYAKFAYGTEEERRQFGQAMVQSLLDWGFFKLKNHGISDEAVAAVMDAERRFFYLPEHIKQQVACVPGPNPQRGWSGQGADLVYKTRKENYEGFDDVSKLNDAREHFEAGPPNDSQFANLWPDERDVPGFRDRIAEHFVTCRGLALELMAAMEMGLGLSPGVLVERCREDASEICLNRYPAIESRTLAEGFTKRIWPHTDYGIITLLFQDGVGGLELEDRRRPGTFLPVAPTPPGEPMEMVVNASDTLERWTNGVIRAGLHRVTLPYDEKRDMVPERFSCAFFCKANRQTSAGPLPHFVTQDRPAKFEDISALEWHKRRTQMLYG